MQNKNRCVKKVLFLCTENSCRSIIAEALTNFYFDFVEAKSAGVKANSKVNKYTKKVLIENRIWDKKYHSKRLNDVNHEEFDLVVSVCDKAKESCPIFPKKTQHLHVGFKDPDKESYKAFEELFKDMKRELLPMLKSKLCG